MPKFMKHQNLQLRTKQFALEVVKFCESLPKDETSRMLPRQLLRSGTSVGANYRAVCRSKSKPDFISKLGTVLEEADESAFWIELLVDSGKTKAQDAAGLLREAGELVAISIASINTARAKPSGETFVARINSPLCTPNSPLKLVAGVGITPT